MISRRIFLLRKKIPLFRQSGPNLACHRPSFVLTNSCVKLPKTKVFNRLAAFWADFSTANILLLQVGKFQLLSMAQC